MRLIENKEYIVHDKVLFRLCQVEDNIVWNSNVNIWHKLNIWVSNSITSDYLIGDIYNEITR